MDTITRKVDEAVSLERHVEFFQGRTFLICVTVGLMLVNDRHVSWLARVKSNFNLLIAIDFNPFSSM